MFNRRNRKARRAAIIAAANDLLVNEQNERTGNWGEENAHGATIPAYLTNSRFSAAQMEHGGNVFGDEVRCEGMDETSRVLDGKGF